MRFCHGRVDLKQPDFGPGFQRHASPFVLQRHHRALLGSFGFRLGTPVAVRGGDGALQALPVVKRWCSLTELQDVCRNDPGVEIRIPLPGTRPPCR